MAGETFDETLFSSALLLWLCSTGEVQTQARVLKRRVFSVCRRQKRSRHHEDVTAESEQNQAQVNANAAQQQEHVHPCILQQSGVMMSIPYTGRGCDNLGHHRM